MSIAQDILRIVQSELADRKIQGAVRSVLLRAGKMNAVVPEILAFHFDTLKGDYPPLLNARLDVEEIPLEVSCPACGTRLTLDEPFFVCETCGGPLSMESGEGIWVAKISTEGDEDGNPSG
jgi:hydrogenase nickel incorporation protein HypA/HybF